MKSKEKRILRWIQAMLMALCFSIGMIFTVQAAVPTYVHDPRMNAKAMEDIRYDSNAVYGFSSREDSTRLGAFASYDFSDPVQVDKWQKERIAGGGCYAF